MKVCILGGGFIAKNLIKYLEKQKDINILAVGYEAVNSHASIRFDIRNSDSIELCFINGPYNIIINCTGISNFSSCEDNNNYSFDVNCHGPLNILDYIHCDSHTTRFINLGSIREFDSDSWYARTKKISREIVGYYREQKGMWAAQLYLPNIVGKEQDAARFVVPKVIDFVENFAKNPADSKLKLGNLDSTLNLIHVDTACELIWRAAQSQTPIDYLLTGEKILLKDFVVKIFQKFGIQDWENYVEIDQSLVRPNDNPYYIELVKHALKSNDTVDDIINKLCQA